MIAPRLVRQPQALRALLSSRVARHASTAPSITVINHSSSETALPLSNVEAQWEKLSREEKIDIHRQLERLQKKDWKVLSIDEKKAAYYIAFGPHGPRTPVNPPGTALKVTASVLGLIGVAAVLFGVLRSHAAPPPKTLTKEWQEASNEYAREQNLNPITGISSHDYKGKGFVQS